MELFACYFNMDTGCVDAWFRDGTILSLSIDCTKFEHAETENMYQRAELDYLIYNDPEAYVNLVLNGGPKAYLQVVTENKKGGLMGSAHRLF